MNKNTKRKIRRGYIGIEVVIISAIMLMAGFVALQGAVSNNDKVANFVNTGLDTNPILNTATGIKLVEQNVEMGIGSNASVILHWIYQPYNTAPTANPSSVTWTVAPANILTITQDGRMIATGLGTATVTVAVTVGGEI